MFKKSRSVTGMATTRQKNRLSIKLAGTAGTDLRVPASAGIPRRRELTIDSETEHQR